MKVSEKYSVEIQEIYDQINKLKTNCVYELSNVRSDGKVSTIGYDLEERVNDLINKIDNQKLGIMDEVGDAVKKAGL